MNKEEYKKWCVQEELRQFCGEDFYKWASEQYSNARNHLKTCGKPKDWYDIFLINFNKDTCRIFRRF